MPEGTGDVNRVAGIYESACHPKEERTILDGQQFPRCGSCNRDTTWVLVRPLDIKPTLKTKTAKRGRDSDCRTTPKWVKLTWCLPRHSISLLPASVFYAL